MKNKGGKMKRKGTIEIINHYGVIHQLKKLAEEVWELNEAVLDYENKKEDDVNHIIEELADVQLLLNQIAEYYEIGITDIKIIIAQKIKRTLERMEKENDK